MADLAELPALGGSGRPRRGEAGSFGTGLHHHPEERRGAAGAQHPSAAARPSLLPRLAAPPAAGLAVPAQEDTLDLE